MQGKLIATQEPLVLWITLGLVGFLIIPAAAVPLNRRWRSRHNQARAVVNRHAIWIGGRFQTWTQLGAHLTAVEIDATVSPRLLCITFRFYARTGRAGRNPSCSRPCRSGSGREFRHG
ncbi:MAG: hypothetical protein WCL11_25610 [Verrucomicrobiota bacterium]